MKVLFVIKIKGIHFIISMGVLPVQSCQDKRNDKHYDPFEAKSSIKTQVGFYFNNKE